MNGGNDSIWVFVAAAGRFPGALFRELEAAEAWISKTGVSGVLTRYPIDVSVYDWAIATGRFTPKRPEHEAPEFIGSFTSAAQEHYHYRGGRRA